MSSNLLKYGYNYQAPSNTDKRIIDTNELVAKRINALSTVLHPEGFIGGLQAEDVSSLIEETGEDPHHGIDTAKLALLLVKTSGAEL